MIRISASFIKDYLSCRARGFYRINSGDQAIQTDDMIIGEVVHKTIETCWDRGYEEGLYFARNLLSQYNIIDLTPRRIEKLELTLSSFFDDFRHMCSEGDQIEQFFTLPFSEKAVIVGKMDWVTKSGLVLDWKTATRVPKKIDSDVQFILYDWAYKKLYKREPQGVYYVSLWSGQMIPYNRQSYLFTQLFGKVIPEIIKGVEEGKFSRTGLYNGSCYGCSFNSLCWKEMHKL
jgi:CRISPR/Cas system-associated exonuclease Cas4 (RecB family)